MKNLLKKFAVMMASVMLMMTTFAVPSFAADTESTISIAGVTNAQAVEAFKIVKRGDGNKWEMVSTYGGKGTDGKWYVKDSAGALTSVEYNIKSPSAAAISAIAALIGTKAINTTNGDFSFGDKKENGNYENTGKDVGTWFVRVKAKDAGIIYNPMLVSRESGQAKSLTASDAQAKSSDIPFDKVVDRDAGKNGNKESNPHNGSVTKDTALVDADKTVEGADGNRGDTAGTKGKDDTFVGDKVWYRINTKIPAYDDVFFTTTPNTTITEAPQFNVHDTLSAGLTLQSTTVAVLYKDGDTWKDVPAAYYKKTDKKDGERASGFDIEFTEAGIKALRGKDIEVRYQAQVNENAKTNFDAETNTASFDYTRNPGETPKEGKKNTTYHYTFTVNGKIDGNDSERNREVVKVGTDESGNRIFEETETITEKGWKPLAGVTFELYKSKDGETPDGGAIKTATTNADGLLIGFNQLDAGKYVFKETSLGTNTEYALDENDISLEIKADLRDDGRLDHYEVWVDGKCVGRYTKQYQNDSQPGPDTTGKEGVNNGKAYEVDASGNQIVNKHKIKLQKTVDDQTVTEETKYEDYGTAADIRNSNVGTLPSTGGMGTILFTAGGIVIMALALFLLFGNRRKQHQK